MTRERGIKGEQPQESKMQLFTNILTSSLASGRGCSLWGARMGGWKHASQGCLLQQQRIHYSRVLACLFLSQQSAALRKMYYGNYTEMMLPTFVHKKKTVSPSSRNRGCFQRCMFYFILGGGVIFMRVWRRHAMSLCCTSMVYSLLLTRCPLFLYSFLFSYCGHRHDAADADDGSSCEYCDDDDDDCCVVVGAVVVAASS